MKSGSSIPYKQTISAFEFALKFIQLFPRLGFMAYHGIKGLKSIAGDINDSWGLRLEKTARKYPDNIAVKSPDGNLNYRELNERANQFAHFFISKNVSQGDTVIVCLENRPELLAVYCGCSKIGAVCALINTNQRGESLVHSFNLNKGRVFIVGEECVDFYREVRDSIDLEGVEECFINDPAINRMNEKADITEKIAGMPVENPGTTGEISIKKPIAYVYTSGTTGGLPKAAVIINKRALSATFWFGKVVTNIKSSHTIYIPLPFFHTNALTGGWPPALAYGASIAMRRKFSASAFIDDVKKFGVTHFVYVGDVCRYLMAGPASPGDDKTTLKYIMGNGLRPDIWLAFKKRFGIKKIYEFYGAAEGVGVFTNIMNIDYSVGTSATPFAIVKYDIEEDAIVRDSEGRAVKVGKGDSGLLLMQISEKTPFAGYSDKKKTEEKIVRNAFKEADMWFNTGDLIRDMGFRHAQFVDRLGDTFRWKGENVATLEVEKCLDTFQRISASAVYGVAVHGTDGRAGMAAVIKEEGKEIDLKALAGHLYGALPKFAVPLFIRLVDDFQWTSTHKIKKLDLKNEGYDPGKVKSTVYVLLPDSDSYVPMDDSIYKNIEAGKYRF